MTRKAPRRTAERILEVTLDLFNRFGEPNVSTTLISAEMGISPGNLYYHYPAKDELINALCQRHEEKLDEVLQHADAVRLVEDAERFLRTLFEHIWAHRFLYRDLSDLLSKNRQLETQLQRMHRHKTLAIRTMLVAMGRAHTLNLNAHELDTTANCMVVVLTHWLNHEYVLDPRQALEPANAPAALQRGVAHVMHLLPATVSHATLHKPPSSG